MASILLNLNVNTGNSAKEVAEVNKLIKQTREELKKEDADQQKLTRRLAELNEKRKVHATILRNESKANISNAKSIAQVRSRVNILKQAIEQVDTSTAKGRAQFEKYRKELKQGETKLRDFNQELGRGRTFVGEYGKGFLEAGKNLAGMIGIGVGIAALTKGFSDAVGVFSDFEQSNANLAAVLGKNIDSIGRLTADAKRLGASTKFTASEVSGLQTEFAKLGFAEEQILSITEATLDLAAASGADLQQASKVAGSTIRAFGLEADDAGRVVDVMAKSFSSSSLDITKFETAMRSVAPVAKNAGLSIEQTTALIGTLTDRGIDASTAGTGLRNVFLNLSKEGISFEEAMNRINNATDKNRASLELFGKRGAVIGTILAETGEDVDALTQKLNNAGGAAQRMAETQLDTLSGSVTILNSAWEGFILGLEDGSGLLATLIRNFVDAGTSLLGLLTVTDKASEKTAELNANFNAEIEVLKNANLTQEQRAELIEDINFKYGDYLQNLLTEESSIREIEAAQKAANKAFIERIQTLAIQEELTEATEKAVKINRAIIDQEIEIQKLRDASNKSQGEFQVAQAQAGQDTNQLLAAAESNIKLLRSSLKEAQAEYATISKIALDFGVTTEENTKKNKGFVDALSLTSGAGDEEVDKAAEKAAERRAKALLKSELEANKLLDQLELDRIKDKEEKAKALAVKAFEDKVGRLIGESEAERNVEQQLKLQLAADLESIEDEFRKKRLKKEEEAAKKQLEIDQKVTQGRISIASNLASTLASQASQGSIVQKQLASVAALLNTYQAISAAIANGAKFGPIAVAAQVAQATALGFANLAKINAVKPLRFQDGGMIAGPSHANGGVPFSVGGVGGFEAEGGEVIINKRSSKMFAPLLSAINSFSGFGKKFQDGGVVSAPISAPSIASAPNLSGIINTEQLAAQIGEAVSENTNVVLPVETLNETQNNVNIVENTVTF